MIRRLVLCAITCVALAGPALASTPVALRASPQAAGRITLGDLFEDAGQAADVVIGSAGPTGGQAVLDAGAVQMAAKRAGLDWANAEGRRRIVVESVAAASPRPAAAPAPVTSAPLAPAPATARPRPAGRSAQALAYARNLNAGDIVAASDLVWSDEAVAPGDAVSDADAAIGKAVRRPIRAGAAVAQHDLASPKVIKRGQMIDVAFEDDGITLVLQAQAQGDASVGDTLVVQNLASHKTLEAVASAPLSPVTQPVVADSRGDGPRPATANSLWRNGARTFFHDQRASRVGDILTVLITINDAAKVQNETVANRKASITAGASHLLGLESTLGKLLPSGFDPSNAIGTSTNTASDGLGSVNRSETINLTVAAIVSAVLPNGNLVIQGRQETRINNELRELTVAGIVRPEDITSTNTINHTQIAEARISYGGRGQLTNVQGVPGAQSLINKYSPF